MIPLYTCRACGFLSTLRSEFSRRGGVLFDNGCLDRADSGDQTVAKWVAEAIEADASLPRGRSMTRLGSLSSPAREAGGGR